MVPFKKRRADPSRLLRRQGRILPAELTRCDPERAGGRTAVAVDSKLAGSRPFLGATAHPSWGTMRARALPGVRSTLVVLREPVVLPRVILAGAGLVGDGVLEVLRFERLHGETP